MNRAVRPVTHVRVLVRQVVRAVTHARVLVSRFVRVRASRVARMFVNLVVRAVIYAMIARAVVR